MSKPRYQTIIGIVLGFASCIALISFGCQGVKPLPNPAPNVSALKTGTAENAAQLKTTTTAIKNDATQGQSKTPDNAKAILNPYWIDLLIQGGVQDSIVKSLQDKDAQFSALNTQIATITADDTAQKAQVTKLQAEATSAYHTLSIIGFGLGMLGIAAGVVLMLTGFVGGKIVGIAGAALSVTCIVFGLITKVVDQVNVYVIFGSLVICLGAAGWYFIKHKAVTAAAVTAKTVAEKNVALAEKDKAVAQMNLTNVNNSYKATLSDLEAQKIKYTAVSQEAQKAKDSVAALDAKLKIAQDQKNEMEGGKTQAQAAIDKAIVIESKVSALGDRVTVTEKKMVAAEKTVDTAKTYVEAFAAGFGTKVNKELWTVRAV